MVIRGQYLRWLYSAESRISSNPLHFFNFYIASASQFLLKLFISRARNCFTSFPGPFLWLFPPHSQVREKALGMRLETVIKIQVVVAYGLE